MKKVVFFIVFFLFLVPSINVSAHDKSHTNNIIFMYGGTSEEYMEMLSHTHGQAGTLSPPYFYLDQQGNLIDNVDQQFVEKAHSKGYKVTPFLGNGYIYELGVKAMENRRDLSSQIARAVLEHDLDGVILDIENLTVKERDERTELLQLVAGKLHPYGKTVAICIGAATMKTSGFYQDFDFKAIGQIVDTVFVMTYDHSYPGSEPGSVAPYDWVEDAIQYLTTYIPNEKLVLGLPFYGRYWTDEVKGSSMSIEEIRKLVWKNNAEIQWSNEAKSLYTKFTDESTGTPYEIWYENAGSLMLRIDLVDQYNLQGWGAWSLGWGDPALWDKLAQSDQVVEKTLAEKIVESAESFIGDPVTSDHSADFVAQVFKAEGVTLPRDAQLLGQMGQPIADKTNLKPGDIVLFGGSEDHLADAGIYIGDGQFVIAYNAYGSIKTMDMNGDVARQYYVGAVRVEKPIERILAEKVVDQAKSRVGEPVTNNSSAAFVANVYAEEGLDLPADIQSLIRSQGQWIPEGYRLQPGDLVFFGSSQDNPQDVGIYIGNARFVVSYKPDGEIKIKHLYDNYLKDYYLGAVRVTHERIEEIQIQNVTERAKDRAGDPVKVDHSAAFVAQIFGNEDIELSKNVQSMSNQGRWFTDQSKLQPGDIVFFGGGRDDLADAGIYIGDGKFVIAYKAYDDIKIMNLSDRISKKFYVGAVRVSE
ncbi:MAG TPA: NlpC/P60 family protein [Bacillales bacterium]